jgi:tRNA-dihydrouridine synthase B
LLKIGSFQFDYPVIAAPMAGVSDLPFRKACREHGASFAVAEMLSANPDTRDTQKSQWRSVIDTSAPHIVQIVGNDPDIMAEAARFNQEQGADIIDINMGCPAKKVCKKAAGSALLGNETLVQEILTKIVNAVDVPVTLKIRTGTTPEQRNAYRIAKIAEDCGIRALTIHGRTRACAFKGNAEYDTIAKVVQDCTIPVIANGDITSPEKALAVLNYTKATGLMIGRAAQGQPWLLGEIRHFWKHGVARPAMSQVDRFQSARKHLAEIQDFYGEFMGVRFARKHAGWYFDALGFDRRIRKEFNTLTTIESQRKFLFKLELTHHFTQAA